MIAELPITTIAAANGSLRAQRVYMNASLYSYLLLMPAGWLALVAALRGLAPLFARRNPN